MLRAVRPPIHRGWRISVHPFILLSVYFVPSDS